jgi:hypothetical protein
VLALKKEFPAHGFLAENLKIKKIFVLTRPIAKKRCQSFLTSKIASI